MAALLALALRVLGLGGRALTSRPGLAALGGAAAFDIGPFGDDHEHRRRRRRRALTASDKADIAFISGTLGKPAGRDFAMIVAART